jgi:hypothetical protein
MSAIQLLYSLTRIGDESLHSFSLELQTLHCENSLTFDP